MRALIIFVSLSIPSIATGSLMEMYVNACTSGSEDKMESCVAMTAAAREVELLHRTLSLDNDDQSCQFKGGLKEFSDAILSSISPSFGVRVVAAGQQFIICE